MDVNKIEDLKNNFPEVFDIRAVPEIWDEDFHVIDRHDNYPDPFEGELFPSEQKPVADLDPNLTDQLLGELEEDWPEMGSDEVIYEDGEILESSSKVVEEIFGDKFPGAPGGGTTAGTSSSGGSSVNRHVISVSGFYLPWHNFDKNTWGIYIFAEGIVALGQMLNKFSRGKLPIKECNLVARTFIYHHEAYHNKVESFSSRLEIVSRTPVYNKNTIALYLSNGFNSKASIRAPKGHTFHEESLANAYAFKMCDDVFRKYKPSQKEILKRLSRRALSHVISSSPPKYRDAKHLVPYQTSKTKMDYLSGAEAKRRFEEVESIFNEEILGVYSSTYNSNLWLTQTKLMDPTLRRNGYFQYLINKKSSLAKRAKLAVHYLNRRQFLGQLQTLFPDGKLHNAKGNKRHSEKFRIGSLDIPIPSDGKKEINKFTAAGILKQLGSDKNIDEVMRLKK